jgi:ATP-binding cassette, subfamily G (WHITE), member 2, SNQ2
MAFLYRAQIPLTRSVFLQRHQKAALYHPFVEAAALTLVDAAISIVIIAVFSVILYFMTGY